MRKVEFMKNVIEIKNLTKYYKTFKAIDNLSFEVKKGEILGLLGPNGSGKSTTIGCLLSLLNYTSGSIKIFGENMEPDAYHLKEKIGVVFQDVAVFDELTVSDNIDYFCGLYITDKNTRKQCIEDALQLVGLTEYQKKYPKQLSGGLLRRLNIACGIAHKPEIIILDEPTVAVDPQSRNHILEGIKELNKKGATIIYTTHYMEEVELICNRIIIIDKGEVIASGTNDELKHITQTKEKVAVEIKDLEESHIDYFKKLKNIIEVEYEDNLLHLSFSDNDHNLNKVIDYLNKNKIEYQRLFTEQPTLNDVFLELTGKELRD